ncbi:MAG: mycofactocin biosynthesis chaperone MftB [Thermodesulfovibrionales bacterium]|nr:mycofactocin biosynthesis chaperone MftB [Thermodesulfovibrionales bacterium]
METITESRYKLARGTQVRQENFGLLFYTMAGPRLYFLSSGELLDDPFFQGQSTLDQWIQKSTKQNSVPVARALEIKKTLDQLREKGVILEC